jgi:hypothetical protein
MTHHGLWVLNFLYLLGMILCLLYRFMLGDHEYHRDLPIIC